MVRYLPALAVAYLLLLATVASAGDESAVMLSGVPETSRFHKNPPSLLMATENLSQTVISHLRADKGIDIKPLSVAPAKSLSLSGSVPKDTEKTVTEAKSEMIRRNTSVSPIPECKKDELEKKPSGYKPKSKNERGLVFFDVLFIERKDLPLDPEVVFGDQTKVFPFSVEDKTPLAQSIEGLNLPCLPYRIRGTPLNFIRAKGVSALKNYSKDPNGNGELHEIMKLKLARK